MTKVHGRLALRQGAWPGASKDTNPTSVIPSGQSPVHRRAPTRLTVSQVPFVSAVRLRYGPAVTLIDLSSEGAQIDTTSCGLQPGSMVIVEMRGQKGTIAIPAQVVRCALVNIQPAPVYRAALTFTRSIDLEEDLGSDSLATTVGLPPGQAVN